MFLVEKKEFVILKKKRYFITSVNLYSDLVEQYKIFIYKGQVLMVMP